MPVFLKGRFRFPETVKVTGRHYLHISGSVLKVEDNRRVHLRSKERCPSVFVVDVTSDELDIVLRRHRMERLPDAYDDVDTVILRNKTTDLVHLDRRYVLYRAFLALFSGFLEYFVILLERALWRSADRAGIRRFAES